MRDDVDDPEPWTSRPFTAATIAACDHPWRAAGIAKLKKIAPVGAGFIQA
jgi:hypothetical protein